MKTQADPMKPGPRTSEFWVTLLAAAAGVYLLIATDKTAEGMALLSLTGGAYAISRGMVKGAAVKALAPLTLCLAMTSCGLMSEYGGPDFHNSAPIMKGVKGWAGDYVREDATISPAQRAVRLGELEALDDQQDAGLKWQGAEKPAR